MEKNRMETPQIRKLIHENKLFPYLDYLPDIHHSVFLASGVKIIGNVKIGEDSSVWYNTVIRGDVHYISIGKMTNIQDCSMLHVTNNRFPLNIGDKVTVGHSVTLHGCTLSDMCLIGMGSIILDGAIIEEKVIVGAGAVVTPGFVISSGKLAAGIPARIIRDLTEEEKIDIVNSAERYKKYTEITINSLKTIE